MIGGIGDPFSNISYVLMYRPYLPSPQLTMLLLVSLGLELPPVTRSRMFGAMGFRYLIVVSDLVYFFFPAKSH